MSTLIITGIYRSGTTLVQKLLDANPNMAIMNHGMMGYFQMMKPFLFQRSGLTNPEAPIGFHWVEPTDDVMSLFRNTAFGGEMVMDLVHRVELEINEDRKRSGNISHPTVEWLSLLRESLRPGTAEQTLLQQLELIPRYKRSPEADVFGFKELHLEQFVSPMLADIPNLKVIQIIRDPRAILASRNFSEEFLSTRGAGAKHPIRLISTVWKTGVRYKYHLSTAYPTSFLSIRYEELVQSPESATQEICEFLGVNWNPVMLDVSSFQSESGNRWVPNTSFDSLSGFDARATEKWRSILPKEEHAVMEYLCGELLDQEGYEQNFDHAEQKNIFREYREDPEDLAPWTRQPLLQIHG